MGLAKGPEPVGARLVEKLAVVGVGLIGASFALALKRAGVVGRVVGVGRSRANMQRALELGAIDEIGAGLAAAVAGADLVLVAVPVAQTGDVLAGIAPHLSALAVVTDAGSTKQDVVAAARASLGARLPCFVPGHPVAGAETSGADAADPNLYRERTVILTPLAETNRECVELVRRAWSACGARVIEMAPDFHDETLAAVSHLPHVLAFALVGAVSRQARGDAFLEHAGSGFRDATRIAASSPEMWRDICLANRDALLRQLENYRGSLDEIRELLERGDGAGLERLFAAARRARLELNGERR